MNFPEFQLPVPANPPDAGTAYYCEFGQDWLPSVLTVLEHLKDESVWLSPPADILAQVDELIARIMSPLIVGNQIFPRNQLIFMGEMLLSAGAAIVPVIDTAQMFNGYWRQSPSVQNDEWYFIVTIDATITTLVVFGVTGANSGIITFTTDEGHTCTIDMWSAATVRNARKTAAIQFDVAGVHSIVAKLGTKNVSSGGYAALVDYVMLY